MNDTYAVVNKPKKTHQLSSDPAYTVVTASGGSRSLPSSHHYDNDLMGRSPGPVYSTVKPRVKAPSQQQLATPIYDIAAPANQSSEGSDYHLVTADDDYEDVSSSLPNTNNFCSPGGIGFNCRVQKPRGPRDPPAEWDRLER